MDDDPKNYDVLISCHIKIIQAKLTSSSESDDLSKGSVENEQFYLFIVTTLWNKVADLYFMCIHGFFLYRPGASFKEMSSMSLTLGVNL